MIPEGRGFSWVSGTVFCTVFGMVLAAGAGGGEVAASERCTNEPPTPRMGPPNSPAKQGNPASTHETKGSPAAHEEQVTVLCGIPTVETSAAGEAHSSGPHATPEATPQSTPQATSQAIPLTTPPMHGGKEKPPVVRDPQVTLIVAGTGAFALTVALVWLLFTVVGRDAEPVWFRRHWGGFGGACTGWALSGSSIRLLIAVGLAAVGTALLFAALA